MPIITCTIHCADSWNNILFCYLFNKQEKNSIWKSFHRKCIPAWCFSLWYILWARQAGCLNLLSCISTLPLHSLLHDCIHIMTAHNVLGLSGLSKGTSQLDFLSFYPAAIFVYCPFTLPTTIINIINILKLLYATQPLKHSKSAIHANFP